MQNRTRSQKNLNEEKPRKSPDLEKGHMAQNQRSLQPAQNEENFVEKALVILSTVAAVITLPFSLFFILVIVRQFERAIIFRNGRALKTYPRGFGFIYYLPCIDSLKFVDLRTCCYAVPPQEALTKDSLTVAVDAVVFYKIFDPILAMINVTDYQLSTHFLAATTLRNALGTRKLTEILAFRPEVSHQVYEFMNKVTMDWGIQIVRVEIKDIKLPQQLQKAMAAEAESTRLANAKIIVAKAEVEATKNLQLATNILMENPMCMQLRYLQSLQTISGDKTHTIVFPFSPDVVKSIFR